MENISSREHTHPNPCPSRSQGTLMHQGIDRHDQVSRAAYIASDLSHLPGASTPDWCQRAAETFTRHDPSTRALVVAVAPGQSRVDRQIESIGHAVGAEAQSDPTPTEILALVFIRTVLETLPELSLPTVLSGDQLLGLVQHPIRGIAKLRCHAHGLVGVAEVETHTDHTPTPTLTLTPAPRLMMIFWDRPPVQLHNQPLSISTYKDNPGLKSEARNGHGGHAPDDLRVVLESVLPIARDRLHHALGNSKGDNPWLSVCEQRVLDLLIEGMSGPQIARFQGRSPHTVHDHVKRLYAKLGANSRGELLARVLGNTPQTPLPTPVVRHQKPMAAFRPATYIDHRGW